MYKVKLLSISTPDNIYVFDLSTLDAERTMSELKAILDNETVLKVVYDARGLNDNFTAHFNFKVHPVFDLMLAAAQFHPHQEVLSLKECAKSVLGVLMEIDDRRVASDVLVSNDEIATKTAYHLAMYHKLTQKIFVKSFQKPKENQMANFLVNNLDTNQEYLEKTNEDRPYVCEINSIDFSVYASG